MHKLRFHQRIEHFYLAMPPQNTWNDSYDFVFISGQGYLQV